MTKWVTIRDYAWDVIRVSSSPKGLHGKLFKVVGYGPHQSIRLESFADGAVIELKTYHVEEYNLENAGA